MDVNSARYLVSALIQATAIAWAFAMTVFVFIYKFGRNGYDPAYSEMEEEVKVEHAPASLRLLTFMNVMAFLTVIAGILALASIEESFEVGFTFTTASIVLTAVFSVMTFLSLTVTIQGLLQHWPV